jgi:hypothetical protein
MCRVEGWTELKLYASGTDARPEPLIPVLIDPVLVVMHGSKMLFRGMERQGAQGDPNSATILQEWSVQIVTEPQPGVAQQSHRPPS